MNSFNYFLHSSNKIKQSFTLTVIIFFGISCSSNVEKYLPDNLDGKGKAIVKERMSGNSALKQFFKNEKLKSLLSEFRADNMACAIYKYKGIKIIFGIGKFSNPNNAFGVYSVLTSEPRKRWKYKDGQLSYKMPFFSGWIGRYAFWIYSPSNPTNYFHFYKTHGEKLFAQLPYNEQRDRPMEHWRILPDQGRYRNSEIYIYSRKVNKLTLQNCYGALYQLGDNKSYIFIATYPSSKKARQAYDSHKRILQSKNIKTKKFYYTGTRKWNGFFWEEKKPEIKLQAKVKSKSKNISNNIVYRYRWFIIYVFDTPEQLFARKSIRSILFKMTRVRKKKINLKAHRD